MASRTKNIENKLVPDGRYITDYVEKYDRWQIYIITARSNIASPPMYLDRFYFSYTAAVEAIESHLFEMARETKDALDANCRETGTNAATNTRATQ